MSIINTLLLSARYKLQDVAGSTFSDYVLMDQYNNGNKILRNTILDHLPMQLSEKITGTVLVNDVITIPKKPIKFIDIRINKRRVNKINITEIPDLTTTGEPRAYYLTGTSTMNPYPIPDKTYDYVITYIPESITMQNTDDSGYQTDVEELLVQYIVAMLSGKGFDLVAEYNATIGKLLGGIETGVTVIDGYYCGSNGGGDYN